MYYGHLLDALKRYDEAVGQYEKAIQLDPTKTDLYKNISTAYEQKNDYKKAIAIKCRPRQPRDLHPTSGTYPRMESR